MGEYGSIENQILDTIEMIASSAIEGAGYDRTVAASVVSCVDTEAAKYKIRYQDAVYYATSNDAEKKYSDGAQVYILVPGNDFSKEKKIIGLVGDLKEDTENQIDQNPYIIVGSNCGSLDVPQGYSSYKGTEEVILYKAGAKNNILSINEKSLATYIKDSTRIRIGMDFKTSILKMQEGGFYGLIVNFSEKNVQDTENPHIKTIAITNSDMIGYPYCSIDWITQSKDFEINGENFIKIEEVKFFLERFKEDETQLNIKDIQIKNFVIGGLAHIDSAVMNTYFLDIQKPYGKTFNSSLAYTNLELKALLKLKNQPLISSTAIEYYWFKENPEVAANEAVTKDSIPRYHSCGGEGWECLNAFQREVYDKNGNKATNETKETDKVYKIKWTSQESYMVKKSDIKIEKVNYKCVAVRSGAILAEAETDIINEDAPYKMEIISDDGNFKFNDSIGSKNLTLKVIEKASGNQVLNSESNGNKYRFYWGEITSTKTYRDITFDKTIPEYKIEGRDVYLEKRLFGSFKHVIGKTESGSDIEELIGTVSQKITNVRTPKEKKPYVNIENGEQVFIYDEAGISPNDSSKDPRQTLMPLTFSLYDADGKKIEMTENFDAEITWFFPKENTMLQDARQKLKDEEGKEVEFSDTEDGSFIKMKVDGKYNPWLTLPFNIRNRYSSHYVNNTIKLEVKYNNQVLQDFTNFIFTKEGKSGTNGTDTFGRILLNSVSPEYGFEGRYPTLVYFSTDEQLMINGGPNNTLIGLNSAEVGGKENFPFKAELWKNGRLIEFSNIRWTLKQNRDVEAISYFKIETVDDNPRFTFIDDNISIIQNSESFKSDGYIKLDGDSANQQRTIHTIVQADIIYKEEDGSTNRHIYAELPLAVVIIPQSYNDNSLYFQVKNGTGFNEIVFNNDGTNPQVGSTLPFEIEVLKADGTPAIGNFTYSWKRANNNSKSYLSFVARDIPLENPTEDEKTKKEKEEDSFNYKNYQPAEKLYSGYDLDIALYCEVKKDGNLLGTIHFPIYALLNKYGHAALNDWDGNSIKFVEDGKESYILTPQIGAGEKDYDKNTFTGMVMGVVKSYDTEGNSSTKNGLIGYSDSVQSVYLSAEDGHAEFGLPGSKIVIDPSSNVGKIWGGEYYINDEIEKGVNSDSKGMLINLSDDETKSNDNERLGIFWASGNFSVNHEGILRARGADVRGAINVNSNNLYNVGYDTFETFTSLQDGNKNIYYGEHLPGRSTISLDGNAYHGQQCLKVVSDYDNDNDEVYFILGIDDKDKGYGYIPITRGLGAEETYLISAYVKTDTPGTRVTLWAVEHENKSSAGASSDMINKSYTIGTAGKWERFSFAFKPKGEKSNYLKLRFDVDLPKKTIVWLDAIQIEKGYIGQDPGTFSPAGSTIIDGGMIMTNSIHADKIQTNTIEAVGSVTAGQFYLGKQNDGTYLFQVDSTGKLSAAEAVIKGTLTAGSGSKIGPWYISNDSISKNSGGTAASSHGASGTGNMYFGNNGLSISNVFKVSNTGHLEASSVNIGDGKLTFDTSGLKVSGTITGSTISGSKIACGDYFSVSDTGYLQASSGKIGNFKLTNSGFSTDTDRVEIFSHGRFRMVSTATYTDGDLVWYPSIDITGGFLNLQGRSASNLTTNPNDKYGTVSIDNRGITMKKSDKGEAWLWISNDQKLFDCNFKNTGYIIAGTRIYLNNGYGLRGMKIDETVASINGSNLIAMIDQADNVQIGSTDNSGDTEIVSPLDIYLRCSSGTAYIKGNLDISGSIMASNLSNHTNNSATTQSPNLRIKSNGEIVQIKDGSSKYIKNNIQKIQQEEINPNNLYNLSVYEFKYNKDQLHKNDCRYNKFIPGFIIEELNEIYPIAIDKNESEESINWGWNERYLIPPMLKLIQDQKQNIDKLEETIKKQQEQIDLLMTKLN